jgi:hypothetical protein
MKMNILINNNEKNFTWGFPPGVVGMGSERLSISVKSVEPGPPP